MIWKSRIYLIPFKVVWDTYDINDDKNYYIQNILNGLEFLIFTIHIYDFFGKINLIEVLLAGFELMIYR